MVEHDIHVAILDQLQALNVHFRVCNSIFKLEARLARRLRLGFAKVENVHINLVDKN